MLRRGVFLTLLLWATMAEASPWSRARFARLGVEDGLTNSFVMSFLQDSDGFLWISTQDGLNRYDGYGFQTHQLDPEDPNTVSGNWIERVVEDSRRNLWVALGVGGLEYYDRATGTFHYFRHLPDDPSSLPDNEVRGLGLAGTTTWIATAGGLARVENPSRAVDRLTDEPTYQVHVDDKGEVWVGTATGLARWRNGSAEPVVATPNPVVEILALGDRIWAVEPNGRLTADDDSTLVVDPGVTASLASISSPDRHGRVWLGYLDHRALRFDPTRRVIEDPLAAWAEELPPLAKPLTDGERVWFASRADGLWLFEEDADRLTNFRHRPTDPESLGGDSIWALFRDRSGLIWIGTWGNGISILDPNNQEFVDVHHEPGIEGSLADEPISSFAEGPAGKLWVGSDGGGLYCYDPGTDDLVRMPTGPLPDALPSPDILSLHTDADQQLWIGTRRGLFAADLTTLPELRFRQPRHADDDPRTLPEAWVTQIEPGADGRLWLAHAPVGLTRFDPTTGTATRYDDVASLRSQSAVWALAEDRDGALWIGLPVAGLWRMDPADGSLRQYTWDPEDPRSVNNRTINSLYVDDDNTVWVGTYSGGLDRLRREDDTFVHLTRRDGLPSNMINGIAEAADGTLWLGTNRGLAAYHPETGRIRSFGLQDGLQGLEFRRGAALVDSRGAILMGGTHGFNRFDPGALTTNNHRPPVVITSVKRFDEELLPPSLRLDGPISLSHRDRYLAFEFTALDFANPAKNRYRYRLQGLDPDWVDAGERRFAAYSHVPPGEYVFQVEGSNNDGVWNREGASVTLTIAPPFWQTGWFRTSTAGLLVCLVVAGYQWRTRRMRADNRRLENRVAEATLELVEKNQQLEVLIEEKNELMRIAAHDMRTPLTSVVGYLGLTIDGIRGGRVDNRTAVSDLEEARGATKRVADLLSGMLDISAIEAGKLTLERQRCSLHELLEERSRFHRRLADKKGIQLEIHADPGGPPLDLDRGRIGEVVDNLLSNAIKYTFPGGQIRLRQQYLDDQVVVEVSDTGQGLDETDLGKAFRTFQRLSAQPTGGEPSSGLGLAIVKKIVELHGGSVGVRSRKGEGSTFYFTLPVVGTEPLSAV